MARWLAAGVRILLLVDPTRGVDVGARAEIKRIWTELADAGCAILLVSSDAEEIVEICDRAVVLRSGRGGRHHRRRPTQRSAPAASSRPAFDMGATERQADEPSSEIIAAPIVGGIAIARLLANRSLRDSTLLLVLAVIWIFFYFATNGTFLTQRNLILLALADRHRRAGGDQRGDAYRHPQLRPFGRLGRGADRRRRGGADGEAQRRSGYWPCAAASLQDC